MASIVNRRHASIFFFSKHLRTVIYIHHFGCKYAYKYSTYSIWNEESAIIARTIPTFYFLFFINGYLVKNTAQQIKISQGVGPCCLNHPE